jgi:hypothetical protein
LITSTALAHEPAVNARHKRIALAALRTRLSPFSAFIRAQDEILAAYRLVRDEAILQALRPAVLEEIRRQQATAEAEEAMKELVRSFAATLVPVTLPRDPPPKILGHKGSVYYETPLLWPLAPYDARAPP